MKDREGWKESCGSRPVKRQRETQINAVAEELLKKKHHLD